MREIKFRAWEKNEEMMQPVISIDWDNRTVQMSGLDGESLWGSHFDQVILMQFTGLKDKNGKEIYEGDIVKMGQTLTSVYWDLKNTQWVNIPLEENKREVMGNVWENPELLN